MDCLNIVRAVVDFRGGKIVVVVVVVDVLVEVEVVEVDNGASSVITNLPMIHSQQLKYNYNNLEDILYNNLAIYSK